MFAQSTLCEAVARRFLRVHAERHVGTSAVRKRRGGHRRYSMQSVKFRRHVAAVWPPQNLCGDGGLAGACPRVVCLQPTLAACATWRL